MEADDLLVFGLTPQGDKDGHVFYLRIIDRVKQVPGVESVSIVRNRPGTGWSDNNDLTLDGTPQRRVILPNTNPLGHVLTSSGVKRTIVGVARDSKYTGVNEEPMPLAYYPAMQRPLWPRCMLKCAFRVMPWDCCP
jgi:hypothetical protein